MISPVPRVITASEPSWIAPFTGVDPRQFNRVVRALRREGADLARQGRPWGIPLEDRVLLVAAYWRTNLTLRQVAVSSVSRSPRLAASSGTSGLFSRSGPGSGFARTPCSSWTALWFPLATTRWRSGPRHLMSLVGQVRGSAASSNVRPVGFRHRGRGFAVRFRVHRVASAREALPSNV